MRPERWQKIDEIFHAALQYKADERMAFIDEACRRDNELRRELESLSVEDNISPVKRRAAGNALTG